MPVEHCRSCGAEIRWEKTANGKWTPVNLDDTPHWATCPAASQHRMRGRTDG